MDLALETTRMQASLNRSMIELQIAVKEYRAAKAALQEGLDSTLLLPSKRLDDLCRLSEKMMHAGIRRKAALTRVDVDLARLVAQKPLPVNCPVIGPPSMGSQCSFHGRPKTNSHCLLQASTAKAASAPG